MANFDNTPVLNLEDRDDVGSQELTDNYGFQQDLRGYEFEAMFEVSPALSAYLITEQLVDQ